MKFLKLTFFIVLLSVLIVSCSKSDDDNNNPGPDNELANEQNAQEDRNIPISELNSGIVISGATSNPGLPPAPTNNLDFQISTKNQEAFIDTGLTIKFSTLDDIAGAYILFQEVDGAKADNYFDVSASELYSERPAKESTRKKSIGNLVSKRASKAQTGDEYELDIDFNNIQPGNFCYEICLYDSSNNISVIQRICVTVEAWGGNASIVGEWVFDRYEPADFNDEEETIACNNGQSIVVDYSQNVKIDWTFALNADGSYYEIYDEEYTDLDYNATQESCSAVYGETEIYNDKYSGKWAYNEDDETLTVIDFKYEDLTDSSNNENYEDGELYFEGIKAEVISNELVLTDIYSEEGQQISVKAYFKRK